MGCIKVDIFIEAHDKPQTFLTVVDKMTYTSPVGVAIYVYALLSLLATGDQVIRKCILCFRTLLLV